MKRNNKGITLIALVITIIVMLILVVVTINVATDGGVIKKAQKAKDETKREAAWEELQLAIAAVKASEKELNNENLKDNGLSNDWLVEEEDDGTLTITSPSGEVFTDIGIEEVEKEYIVELADEFGNKYKYYRLNKVTDAQREKCIAKGIPMLVGDANLDGNVNKNDEELVNECGTNKIIPDEYQKILLDLNNDGIVDVNDISTFIMIINKKRSLRIQAIYKETEIDSNKIIIDKETGILYFVEEEVTVEEAKELEKFGVKKLIMGDVNLDGKITVEDADLVEAAAQGQAEAFSEILKKVGDMDKNKIINSQDADLIRNMLNNN